MRRRISLLLLAAIVLLAVIAYARRMSLRPHSQRGHITVQAQDSLAQQDSAARADARRDADTMCIASRFGLPCDPR
jgi:hypothetical protein